jgi:hypothetical protein
LCHFCFGKTFNPKDHHEKESDMKQRPVSLHPANRNRREKQNRLTETAVEREQQIVDPDPPEQDDEEQGIQSNVPGPFGRG